MNQSPNKVKGYAGFKLKTLKNILKLSVSNMIYSDKNSSNDLYLYLTDNIKLSPVMKTSIKDVFNKDQYVPEPSYFLSSLTTGNFRINHYKKDKVAQILNVFIHIIYSNQLHKLIDNMTDDLYYYLQRFDYEKFFQNINDLQKYEKSIFFNDEVIKKMEKFSKINKENKTKYHEGIVRIIITCIIASLYLPDEILTENKQEISNMTWSILRTSSSFKKFVYNCQNEEIIDVVAQYANGKTEKQRKTLNALNNEKYHEFRWRWELVIQKLILVTLEIEKVKEEEPKLNERSQEILNNLTKATTNLLINQANERTYQQLEKLTNEILRNGKEEDEDIVYTSAFMYKSINSNAKIVVQETKNLLYNIIKEENDIVTKESLLDMENLEKRKDELLKLGCVRMIDISEN